MLKLAGLFVQQDVALEKASDLISLRIATVRIFINTLMGRVFVTEEMVVDEIARVTWAVLVRVCLHEKDRVAAQY